VALTVQVAQAVTDLTCQPRAQSSIIPDPPSLPVVVVVEQVALAAWVLTHTTAASIMSPVQDYVLQDPVIPAPIPVQASSGPEVSAPRRLCVSEGQL
jgi:hypothetical protein